MIYISKFKVVFLKIMWYISLEISDKRHDYYINF